MKWVPEVNEKECIHDDVNGNIFSVTGPLCVEFTSPGEFPAQWRGALMMFSLICARINDWVNNREAGDLRRHHGHYDVYVMYWFTLLSLKTLQWRHMSIIAFQMTGSLTAQQVVVADKLMSSYQYRTSHYKDGTMLWPSDLYNQGFPNIWKDGLYIETELRASSPWRHQMETFSMLLAICVGNSPVTGELAVQRPATRSFDVFFDLRLNKWLSKQSWRWWFETPSPSLWCHCNATPVVLMAGTLWENWVKTMPVDALVPSVTRSSGTVAVW